MKVEAWIFGSLTIFFALVTPVYWLITRCRPPEITGTVALILTFFLVLMISVYLLLVARRIEPRPEDKKTARSPRAPASSASSRRTASGRSSSP